MATNITTETVYIDRDNAIDLVLKSEVEGVTTIADLSSVTRIDIVDTRNKFSVTSVGHPTWISWGTGGKLTLVLGKSLIPKGNYIAQVVVFDAVHPNGIVWDEIKLIVEPVHPAS